MKSSRLLVLFSFLIFMLPVLSHAQRRHPSRSSFGLGLTLGDPSGVSAKYYLERNKALDGVLAFDSDPNLHFNYLHIWPGAFRIEGEAFSVHLGIGGHLKEWRHEGDNEIFIGPRVPFGTSYLFSQVPIEVYGEIALSAFLLPETEFDLSLNIGGRFFF